MWQDRGVRVVLLVVVVCVVAAGPSRRPTVVAVRYRLGEDTNGKRTDRLNGRVSTQHHKHKRIARRFFVSLRIRR